MSADRRLGVLGGTFDPIHYGHLDAAEAAQAALALEEMWLIPAHDPPHRPIDPRASAFHRFALVALAIDGRPGWRVSDMELRRAGRSYTVNTLRGLRAQGWRPSEVFFVLGADALADIATWYEFPAVLDEAHFVVVARPGAELEAAIARTPAVRTRLRTPADLARWSEGTAVIRVEGRTRNVSSTDVRTRLAAGLPVGDLVPAAVARHIVSHQLYGAVDDWHGEEQHSHR
jgi:nicotinate-nucleotide adenylyltransferase